MSILAFHSHQGRFPKRSSSFTNFSSLFLQKVSHLSSKEKRSSNSFMNFSINSHTKSSLSKSVDQKKMSKSPKKSRSSLRKYSEFKKRLMNQSQVQKVVSKNESRLQKIMKIQVIKPVVSSVIKNYKPEKKIVTKRSQKMNLENDILVMRETKEKIKRRQIQEQKENRLWKCFERQRSNRTKEKQRKEQNQYKKIRRIEKRFESEVSKELLKYENERQLQLRKDKVFSPYIYPSY